MNFFDGQIFFALIVALVLAWASSVLVARRYTHKVLEFMQTGTAPPEPVSVVDPYSRAQSGEARPAPEPVDLGRQNRYAFWRLRLAFVLISFMLAGIIAYVDQAVYVEEAFSWRRFLILTLIYVWPFVPAIGLLERWPRGKIFLLSLGFMLLCNGLVMLNSTPGQSPSVIVLWLFGQQMPLLVFIMVMAGSKLRAVGPYLLVVFFLLAVSSLIGLSALEKVIRSGPDTWLMDLVLLTNVYVAFLLFSIVPWLIAFYPVRALARRLAAAYRNKAFSESLYMFAGVWSIALLFQAMTLSHGIGFSAYGLLAAGLIVPLSVIAMKSMLRPQHEPPTLLLLRVFRGDDSIESLFDSVVERWRYSGNTVMIAGKDLALRNLEPDELFAFLSGHLRDRFISDEARLHQAIGDLDLQADPDGRYRINEFFCFDSTWKRVLENLVDRADRVLMDLRAYNANRQGCSHELTVLATKPHLQKLVILFDKDTDKQTAERLVSASAIRIVWIDCDAHGKKLQEQVLLALLGS